MEAKSNERFLLVFQIVSVWMISNLTNAQLMLMKNRLSVNNVTLSFRESHKSKYYKQYAYNIFRQFQSIKVIISLNINILYSH